PDITALRLQVRKNGFNPIPVEDKGPRMKGWPKKLDVIRPASLHGRMIQIFPVVRPLSVRSHSPNSRTCTQTNASRLEMARTMTMATQQSKASRSEHGG